MATITDGTVEGLIEFCDYLIDKGYATAAAINPWKSAIKPVFSLVEGSEDYGGVNIKELDVEDYLARFDTKARGAGKLKRESIAAYRSRFTKAIQAYRAYLADGSVPSFRAARRRPPTAPSNGDALSATDSGPVTASQSGAVTTSRPASLIDYPFPLRSGQIAQLRLPLKLERGDAERLAAFVRTLVFDAQLQIGSGQQEGEVN